MHRSKRALNFLAVIVLSISVSLPCFPQALERTCQSSQDDVYRIVVNIPTTEWQKLGGKRQSSGDHVSLELTGFRAKSASENAQIRNGIITSLHGVIFKTLVGSKAVINASNELPGDAKKFFSNLSVQFIDSSRDLAILYSDDLATSNDIKLNYPSQTEKIAGEAVLEVPSHAAGIECYTKPGRASKDAIVSLDTVLPKELREQYRTIKSPTTETKILSMDISITSGSSGAPVIMKGNVVEGVVFGGYGPLDIAWAMPLNDVKWQPESDYDQTELKRIAGLESGKYDYRINQDQAVAVGALTQGELTNAIRRNIDREDIDADRCGAHCHEWYLWLELPSQRKLIIKKVIYHLEAGGIHSRVYIPGVRGPGFTATDELFSHHWIGNECFSDARLIVVPQQGANIEVPFNLCAVPDSQLPEQLRE